MSENILAQDIGDIGFQLFPLEDSPRKVIFMEMAGEYIKRLILLQYIFHHATWIQPVVEY